MTQPPLDHLYWMTQALALAKHAATLCEIPVAALVIHHPPHATPTLIATGHNQREADRDPCAHAEIVALRIAGKHLGHWRLTDCTLYVTLEPCPMCAGALVQARLPRLVYGARDPKAGAVHSLYQLCSDPRLNHRLEIIPDLLAQESADLLKQFFTPRRTLPNPTAPRARPPSPAPATPPSPAPLPAAATPHLTPPPASSPAPATQLSPNPD